MYYGHNSLWGILVLVADIWAIVNIFQSNASTERKVSGRCWSSYCRCWAS